MTRKRGEVCSVMGMTTSTPAAKVTFPTVEMAEFLATDIAGRKDGSTVHLTAAALAILADLPEDNDGHYDGTHIWIGGSEYRVDHPSLDTTDRLLTHRLAISLARGSVTPDEALAAWDAQQAGDGFTFDVLICDRGERQRYNGYHAKQWPSVRSEAVRLSTDLEFLDAYSA